MKDDKETRPRVFVKHADERGDVDQRLVRAGADAFEGATIDDSPASSLAALMVDVTTESFERDGNPVKAIKAFLHCHWAGVYPPVSVLNWIAGAFAEYDDARGDADLLAMLHLKGSRGHSHAYGREQLKNATHKRARWVHWLVNWAGLTIDDAAFMVVRREEAEGRESPDESWVAETYRRGWRKRLESNPWYLDFDDKFKQEFIADFPKHESFPCGFKP